VEERKKRRTRSQERFIEQKQYTMTSIPASAQSYLPNPRKRLRTKSVSWAAEDKLNQVGVPKLLS
jgi:hypothetical protein